MPKFLTVIFCKMYEWHLKYEYSKFRAAQKSAYYVAVMVFINLITFWWSISLICNIPAKVFTGGFHFSIIVFPWIILGGLCHIYFLTKGKYLELYKGDRKEEFNFWGLRKKGFTLTYTIASWVIVILVGILYFKK